MRLTWASHETHMRFTWDSHGTHMRDIIDFQLPYIPENISTTKKQAYTYWADNLLRIWKLAEQNIYKAQQKQNRNYDKYTKPHSFKIGDHVYLKIEKWNENEDTKLKTFKYTIL